MKNKIKINNKNFVCDDYFVLALNGNKADAVSSAASDDELVAMLMPFLNVLMDKLGLDDNPLVNQIYN